MSRVIDADALRKEHCKGCSADIQEFCKDDPVCASLMWLNEAPTIDAVPVVRCKECKYYKPGKYFKDINFCHRLPYYAEKGGLNVADDDFCSYGERRSE